MVHSIGEPLCGMVILDVPTIHCSWESTMSDIIYRGTETQILTAGTSEMN